MARYRGPKLRIIRRLGSLLGLTQKTSTKENPPGQHGKNNRKNLTEYGIRLQEKQKLKFNYGLSENQLFRYIKEARRRKGITGIILFQLLEMRLDSICFNLGFANTIANARQLINHGHITVNGNVVSIASFQCCINDIISVNDKIVSRNLVKTNTENNKILEVPSHLNLDRSKLEGTVLNYCEKNQLLLKLNQLLVIEYYSRR